MKELKQIVEHEFFPTAFGIAVVSAVAGAYFLAALLPIIWR